MKNILLIDGFNFVKLLVCKLINSENDMHVSLSINNVTEWVNDLKNDSKENSIDVIVLDISAPTKNGLESLVDIKKNIPQTPVLIINGSNNYHYAKHFIDIGCNGYISKECDSQLILDGINAVTKGQKFIEPSALYKKIKSIANIESLNKILTKRELQIFLKLANGKSLSHIANDLNISDKTVSSFRCRILKKLHFKTNFEIICYALNHQYLMKFNINSL
jgi:DNA-binding NarL/FixJ family response regulator